MLFLYYLDDNILYRSLESIITYICLKSKRRIGEAFKIKYACFKNFFSAVKRLSNLAGVLDILYFDVRENKLSYELHMIIRK